MTQEQNTTSSRKGKHLNMEERIQIEVYRKQGVSGNQIANYLERSRRTIHKEISDGIVDQKRICNEKIQYYQVYCAEAGQRAYDLARQNSIRRPLFSEDDAFLIFADTKMKEDNWSPDTIVVFSKKVELFSKKIIPCTTTLYQWINKGYMQTRNIDLLRKVSLNTVRKKWNTINKRVLGDSIEKRPETVKSWEEFGHWEIDTVIGLKSGGDSCLLTLTERKTRFELIFKIAEKSMKPVEETLLNLTQDIGIDAKLIFKTMTADNGSEFSSISEKLIGVVDNYFSHPYSSWERGTNENHNGMIRRFIPKGTKINTVSESVVKRVESWWIHYRGEY